MAEQRELFTMSARELYQPSEGEPAMQLFCDRLERANRAMNDISEMLEIGERLNPKGKLAAATCLCYSLIDHRMRYDRALMRLGGRQDGPGAVESRLRAAKENSGIYRQLQKPPRELVNRMRETLNMFGRDDQIGVLTGGPADSRFRRFAEKAERSIAESPAARDSRELARLREARETTAQIDR